MYAPLLYTWWDIKKSHGDWSLCRKDGLISHRPLLRKGQTSKLRGLRESLFELKGHVLRAKKVTHKRD